MFTYTPMVIAAIVVSSIIIAVVYIFNIKSELK